MSTEESPRVEWCGVPRRGRIIDWLRKLYPDQTWRYSGLSRDWHTRSGWSAGWVSQLAPTWEGDDETCISRFYLRRPGKCVLELHP